MRWLKRLGMGLLVAVLVIAALWTWSRLRGPTPTQRAALELMEAPNAFAGRNAFDAIWLLPYDVPDEAIAAVADADMAAVAEAPPGTPIMQVTSAKGRFADLRTSDGAPAPCSGNGEGCLAKVRADPEGSATWRRQNAALVERVQALSRYDHIASRLPAKVDAPFLPLQALSLPLSANAVDFVQANPLAALASACRDMDTLRRIGTKSDLLITRMLAIAYVTDGYGRLLADMLGALPRDTPLPATCEAAFRAPSADEGSICPAMRGEFAQSMGAVDSIPEMREANAWSWLVLDRAGVRASMAEQMAPPCEVEDVDLAADQRLVLTRTPLPAWRRFECVANSVGCLLSDVAGPAYYGYAWRAQDQNARLQLLGTLAWLREQPDEGTLAERLARRPGGLRSPARDITVTADGRSLEIAQYDTRLGDTWSLPLPSYLVDTSPVSD